MAEVRIDPEREFREVTKPGDHSRNVVDRQAVDEDCADAELLEAAGRTPEEVALRGTPVLAVYPADAVAAAPEREPDRESGRQ